MSLSRAVVFATDSNINDSRYLSALWPLVDRPFIQHVIESLVDNGVSIFDIVLARFPEKIEALLEDGKRWGATIRYHLTSEDSTPYSALRSISFPNPDERIVIAHADRLPLTGIPASDVPLLFTEDTADTPIGWATATASALQSLPLDSEGIAFFSAISKLPDSRSISVRDFLGARTLKELLASQSFLLRADSAEFLKTGREVEPGIHLSRNVAIHSAARIIPPVFIGRDCRIGAGAEIGPNAVIADGCIVDEGAALSNCLIFSGSYIGEGIEVCDAVVDRNRLTSVRFDETVVLSDRSLLGDLHTGSGFGKALGAVISRISALILLLIVWPVLLATALYLRMTRPGPVIYRHSYLSLPAASEEPGTCHSVSLFSFSRDDNHIPDGISHLFLVFLPGLISVFTGNVRFVGVPCRTIDAAFALPADWRILYLTSKQGLVTEAFVNFGPGATSDESYSSDAFYVVSSGIAHDASLLLHYFSRVFFPNLRSAREAGTRA